MALNDNDIIWDDDVTWEEAPTSSEQQIQPMVSHERGVQLPPSHGPAYESERQAQLAALLNPNVLNPNMNPEKRKMALAMLGGMVTGGTTIPQVLTNALGGTTGATVGDLINRKFAGEQITAGQTAKDFGTNSLYELIPSLGMMGAGRMIPEGIPQFLMRNALHGGTTFEPQFLDNVARNARKERIPIGRAGYRKSTEEINKLNDEISKRVMEASANGATADVTDLSAEIAKVMDGYEFVVPNGDYLNSLSRELQKSAVQLRGKYPNGKIPLAEVQKIKQENYKLLSKYYESTQGKGVNPHLKPTKAEALAGIAKGAKEEVAAAVPGVSTLNQRESDLLNIRGFIDRAINRSENAAILPPDLIIAGGLETATKGTPGLITGIAAAKRAFSYPGVQSRAALGADTLRGNKAGLVPKIGTTLGTQYLLNRHREQMGRRGGR